MSALLTALAVEQAMFPVADCLSCGARGLIYLDVTDDGSERHRCLRCDSEIPEQVQPGRAGKKAVEALGYAFAAQRSKATKAPKKGGCGAAGIRSCGSGGCSSGSCGTGGGCSSGGCGS